MKKLKILLIVSSATLLCFLFLMWVLCIGYSM
nr:MAG TPA: protein of unknown function (DUF5412) [Caudoviricetes sp.]